MMFPAGRIAIAWMSIFGSVLAEDVDLHRYAVKLSHGKEAQATGVNTSFGIVTCQHIIDGYLDMTAECDGETQTATVIWSDSVRDLAVLQVRWTKLHPIPKTGTVKENLRVAGRGDNGLLRTSSHKFLYFQELKASTEIVFSDPRSTGASGSGLYNERNELVGIFCGKIVETEPYVGRAAKIEDVKITVRK